MPRVITTYTMVTRAGEAKPGAIVEIDTQEEAVRLVSSGRATWPEPATVAQQLAAAQPQPEPAAPASSTATPAEPRPRRR